MKEQLIQWAEAGDGDCMLKLSKVYRDEGNDSEADRWLIKASATKNYFAMKEYAARLRENGDDEAALELYKELVKLTHDVEAMEAVVDMCGNDVETLKFVLDNINAEFNDVYLQGNEWQRMLTFGTRRYNECTIQTLEALDRRRIANRIHKMLSTN